MNRRTRRIEATVAITRLVAAAWKGNAFPPSAFTVATTLDKLHRACVKVARMHLDECNGDHEKCARCAGDGKVNVGASHAVPEGFKCNACGGTGRKTDDEVKAWTTARDRTERRIERMLRDLGFAPPTLSSQDVRPTWEIDRDPRGGPLRLFANQAERENGAASVVLPVEGF